MDSKTKLGKLVRRFYWELQNEIEGKAIFTPISAIIPCTPAKARQLVSRLKDGHIYGNSSSEKGQTFENMEQSAKTLLGLGVPFNHEIGALAKEVNRDFPYPPKDYEQYLPSLPIHRLISLACGTRDAEKTLRYSLYNTIMQ